jgi:epoxyqueuosine reductase QueG
MSLLAKSSLQTNLEEIAKELGADLFGIADLTIAQDFVCKQGGEYLGKFPRAISIGIHLLDAVVDELYRHDDPAVTHTYTAFYNSVNSLLDHIGLLLAKRIQEKGYKTYVIPASQNVDSNKLIGVFSHKLAANLAGLGWIGKSCLLITPSYGPRVRLATILTDAPLEAGSPIGEKCNDCRKCVNTCPAKAFTGAPFNPSEAREVRFNAHLCSSYRKKREEKTGADFLCGLCVYVCPYGRANENLPTFLVNVIDPSS